MKKLVEEDVATRILVIQHTSSKKCKEWEKSEVEDEFGDLRPLKQTWTTRSFGNKI